jgi:hypothetical protein
LIQQGGIFRLLFFEKNEDQAPDLSKSAMKKALEC